MAENNEVTPTEEEAEEETDETLPDPDEERQKLEQIAQDQRRRAEKAEAELKKLNKPQSANIKNEERKVKESPDMSNFLTRDELVEFNTLKDKGYSTAEIQEIKAYAAGKGKTALEVADEPLIKGVIEGMRKQDEVEQTTPPPSSQSTSASPSPHMASFADVEIDEEGKIKKSGTPPSFQEWEQKGRGGNSE